MTDTRVHRFGCTSRSARRASTWAASVAVAVLALGTLAGCGDDTATDTDTDTGTATDGSPSSSPTTPGSASASASATAAPTSQAPPVPEIDPLVARAVMGALDDRFPALIPTVVPDGWTVTSATYATSSWTIELTDASGSPVVLSQQEVALEKLVASTVGDTAQQTGKVSLADVGLGVWGVYEAGESVGIARALAGTAVTVSAVDADTATELAKTLLTAEDADMPEAG